MNNPETNVTTIGHNSQSVEEFIAHAVGVYAEVDSIRKGLSERKAEIRKRAKELEIDTDALNDAYMYFKRGRHQREGYDQSHKLCMDILNEADTGELFAWQAKDVPVADNTKAAG